MTGLLLALGFATAVQQSAHPPSVTNIDAVSVAKAFRLPHRGRTSSKIEVVNAYELSLPEGRRIVASHSGGFLPVEITLDNGDCYLIQADYIDGGFHNGTLSPRMCSKDWPDAKGEPPIPPRSGITLAGQSWGYSAWRDDRTGTTTVVDGWAHADPLILSIDTVGIGAMRGPDSPGGEISLVGRLDGRPAFVTVLYYP